MQLTALSDYSLRLMMMVTAHSDRLVTIEETARAYDISRAHLMKVAHHLVRQGFLKTVRGRTVGLMLARPPEAIGPRRDRALHGAGFYPGGVLRAGQPLPDHSRLQVARRARRRAGRLPVGAGSPHAARSVAQSAGFWHPRRLTTPADRNLQVTEANMVPA